MQKMLGEGGGDCWWKLERRVSKKRASWPSMENVYGKYSSVVVCISIYAHQVNFIKR